MPLPFTFLAAFASVHSIIALIAVVAEIGARKISGNPSITYQWLNRHFARSTWKTWLVQIFSGAAAIGWVTMVLSFMTGDFIGYGGLSTFFGEITPEWGNTYFALIFVNMITAKSCMNFIELFGMLRKGPVFRHEAGVLVVWRPMPAH